MENHMNKETGLSYKNIDNIDVLNTLSIKELMLIAPSADMTDGIREKIKKWKEEPSAIEILEVLDHTLYYNSAAEMVIYVLQMMFELKSEEERVKALEYAEETWRKLQK